MKLKIFLCFSALPDILKCVDGVKYSMIGNGHCNDETNNPDCNYDFGDCCLSPASTDYCSECACATTGVIMSPGFPSDYANNLEVSWLILVASGQAIEINFISFDVEDRYFDADCSE